MGDWGLEEQRLTEEKMHMGGGGCNEWERHVPQGRHEKQRRKDSIFLRTVEEDELKD